MTNLTTLTAALTPVRELYTGLIDDALSWQRETGRKPRTDPDHFALLCVAADAAGDAELSPTRWSRTTSFDLLRFHVPNWCALAGCMWPVQLPEVMWEWFDFLDESGRLHPASDPLCELRKPLFCYAGLDQRGVRLPSGAPRVVECECFLPYRETMELIREISPEGTDPLEPLRRLAGRPPS